MEIYSQDMTYDGKQDWESRKKQLKHESIWHSSTCHDTNVLMYYDLPLGRWSPCQGRLHGSVQHRAWMLPVAPPVLKWATPGSSWWSLLSFSQPDRQILVSSSITKHNNKKILPLFTRSSYTIKSVVMILSSCGNSSAHNKSRG